MPGKRVAILGGGNMGSAIAQAIWKNEDILGIASDRIVIAEPDASKHMALSSGNQSAIVASAAEALDALAFDGLIILAVKPQLFSGLAAEVGDVGPRLVISVMAGCTAMNVQKSLGGTCRTIRAMPNLAVTIGQGVTGLCAGPGATGHDMNFASHLFGRMGSSIIIPESMMNAITAVASSGPAYIFYLAEAMTQAAIELGFEPESAPDIVKQTIRGAAELLSISPEPAHDLRRRVTSKGGTTQAATDVLDQARVKEAFIRAISAARDRGQELSKP